MSFSNLKNDTTSFYYLLKIQLRAVFLRLYFKLNNAAGFLTSLNYCLNKPLLVSNSKYFNYFNGTLLQLKILMLNYN